MVEDNIRLKGKIMSKTRYYLVESFDSNVEVDVDVEEEASEKDAMLAAIEQLGWIFCAKEIEGENYGMVS